MSFQWLQIRMAEETDRRQREAEILAQLPRVLTEVHSALVACVADYVNVFGADSVEINFHSQKIGVTVREQQDGRWEKIARVEITAVYKLPGIHIDRDGEPLEIEVGLLPGEKVFYKHVEEFLTMEELTRRILDRALFPKLGE